MAVSLAVALAAAKRNPAMYYVQLKDKQGCGFTTSNPLSYLSQRAIDRRTRWNIPVDSTDLPLAQTYVDSIAHIGADIYQKSRWMNGLLVYATDVQISTISSLDFVTNAEIIRPSTNVNLLKKLQKKRKNKNTKATYSQITDQNHQVGADSLHNAGFRGQGIQVAVIDAGFPKVNTLPGFDSLRNRGGILGTYNVVTKSTDVYCDHYHGTMCLSTMAFNIPGELVGTAPDADYWLLRTEVDDEEYLYETDLWIIAVEMADSAGVDLISTSLGYFFTDDEDKQFTYSNMNGIHFRSTVAARMAAEKGIVMCVAAGNEGDSDWQYIDTPADADSILCIGGVDRYGEHSSFSSYGPTADGRIKPEVCACATGASVAEVDYPEWYGNVTVGYGTSFATPIAAGTIASLMSALPDVNPAIIRRAIIATASQSNNPDNTLGYGILNGWKAYKYLTSPATATEDVEEKKGRAFISNGLLFVEGYEGEFKMYSPSGSIIGSGIIDAPVDVSPYPHGVYILKCGDEVFKVIK